MFSVAKAKKKETLKTALEVIQSAASSQKKFYELKRKNLFDVLNFLPHRGIGATIRKRTWPSFAYIKVSQVKLAGVIIFSKFTNRIFDMERHTGSNIGRGPHCLLNLA
jgi:hypothetical protein